MDLIDFINSSPSPYHAVLSTQNLLEKHGYVQLKEEVNWELKKGTNYYCIREDASIIAFSLPEQPAQASFKVIGAHTDSPCLKLKVNPNVQQENYHLANIEVYGGALWNSWLDRDLGLAGIVYTDQEKKCIDLKLKARVPQLAIHLDRNVNKDGLKLNPQEHLKPIISHQKSILDCISAEVNGTIISHDLCFYDLQEASTGGAANEWIYAARLDNLAMTHAAIDSLLQSNERNSIAVAACFNHEEVGSNSAEGAGSNFLESVLRRIHNTFAKNSDLQIRLAHSFLLSADMAHALHPNYTDRHDPYHKPLMGQGPVLKTNVNQRYATNPASTAFIKDLAKKAQTKLQDFQGHNNISCGSTIGPMTAAKLGISTIDIGNAMLSMHSAREMAHLDDHTDMIKLMTAWYQS
jgi:aspartyl aminopeptidase